MQPPQPGECIFNLSEFDRGQIERGVSYINDNYGRISATFDLSSAIITCNNIEYERLIEALSQASSIPVAVLVDRVKFLLAELR